MLYKIGALKNLANSLENCAGVCRSLACNYTKMTLAQLFSCKFWEIFKNIFFAEHL